MSRFERWSIWATTAVMTLTGTVYLWMKYFMEPADPWAVVSHPLEPWMLRAHVIVAPFFIFAVGMITANHVWRHLRSGVRWARTSGLVGSGLLVLMVMSGYLIQVLTPEGWIEAMVIVHLASGYLFLIALAVHEWETRSAPGQATRTRRRRAWPGPAGPAGRRRENGAPQAPEPSQEEGREQEGDRPPIGVR